MWNKAERAQLAKMVKPKREELGLNQSELALSADVSRRTVSSIERGETVPHADVLRRLLDALGIEPDAKDTTNDFEDAIGVLAAILARVPLERRSYVTDLCIKLATYAMISDEQLAHGLRHHALTIGTAEADEAAQPHVATERQVAVKHLRRQLDELEPPKTGGDERTAG